MVADRSDELAQFYQELFIDNDNKETSRRSGGRAAKRRDDKALIKQAKGAANGAKFSRLWKGTRPDTPVKAKQIWHFARC